MSHFFIGRQPILDKQLKLYGYELLYRNNSDNEANHSDGDAATAKVMMNAFTETGLNNIVGKHLAFINMPRTFLVNSEILPFEAGRVVLEVLEDIKIDETVITSLEVLLGQGHIIALDDFTYHESLEPIIELAQIIKIDVQQLNHAEIEKNVAALRKFDVELLAEKVETQAEFKFLKDLGFDYFQGYFFARPTVIKGKKIPANKMAVVQLLAKLANSSTDVKTIQDLVKRDVAMSYRILRITNSPLSGLKREIDSIDQAVILLGREAIKKWITTFAMADIEDKPVELMTTSLTRARFCEQLAVNANQPDQDAYFTTGMFSVLDAMMDTDMEKILESLPLDADIISALLKQEGLKGDALKCAIRFEQEQLNDITFADVDEQVIADTYLEALAWADQSLGAIKK